ncbi:MAG: ATP-binding protein [Flavobacteriaceae bacterium]
MENRKPIKIVLVGPESTGKTTLAKLLAAHFNTTWAREFLREFSEEKFQKENKTVVFSDLETIVNEQLKIEKEAENKADTFVFCDTNLLQTRIYAELYFGKIPDFLEDISGECDLYFLTDIDVEWEKDNVRDAPFERENHLNYFKKRLTELKKPFLFLSGNEQERLKRAAKLSAKLKKALDAGVLSQDFVHILKTKPTQK